MDRIDGDALARGENADDAVAGDRAALGEAHRQVAAHASDGNAAGILLARPLARPRPAEFEAHDLAQSEPAFVVALDLAAALGRFLRLLPGKHRPDDVGRCKLAAAD